MKGRGTARCTGEVETAVGEGVLADVGAKASRLVRAAAEAATSVLISSRIFWRTGLEEARSES